MSITSDGTINNYVHNHNVKDVNELQVREVQGKAGNATTIETTLRGLIFLFPEDPSQKLLCGFDQLPRSSPSSEIPQNFTHISQVFFFHQQIYFF